jgi:hypothetical protein
MGTGFASWLGAGNGPRHCPQDDWRETLRNAGAAWRRDSDCGAAAY